SINVIGNVLEDPQELFLGRSTQVFETEFEKVPRLFNGAVATYPYTVLVIRVDCAIKCGLKEFNGQHALRERAKKRSGFEMPYNIWCGGCNSMISKGVRFNSEKKQVDNYYSTKAFELMKKQEETRETRQMEFSAKLVEFKAMRAYARNWAEIGVGLGAEMGVEIGNFAKHWRKLLLGQSCITMMVLSHCSEELKWNCHVRTPSVGHQLVERYSNVPLQLLYFEQDNGGGYSIALQIEAANVSGGHVKPALTFGQELLELQDEEALRQTPEEKARAEKELEEKMKQQKAEYELFTLEFGVQSDSNTYRLISYHTVNVPIAATLFEQDKTWRYIISITGLRKVTDDMKTKNWRLTSQEVTSGEACSAESLHKGTSCIAIHDYLEAYDVPRGRTTHTVPIAVCSHQSSFTPLEEWISNKDFSKDEASTCLKWHIPNDDEIQLANELINRHLESALDKTVKICRDFTLIQIDPSLQGVLSCLPDFIPSFKNEKVENPPFLIASWSNGVKSLFLSDNAPFVFLGFGLLCAAFAVITCSRLIYSHINQVELAVREKNLWSMIGVLKYSWFRIVIVKTTLMIPSEPFHRLQNRNDLQLGSDNAIPGGVGSWALDPFGPGERVTLTDRSLSGDAPSSMSEPFRKWLGMGAPLPARIQPGSIDHVPFPTVGTCLGASLALREKARRVAWSESVAGVVLFDWKSTYQVFLQTSSTYAEYIAAFDASKEAVMDSHSNAKGRDDGVTKGARDNFRAKFTIFAGTIRWDDVRIEKIDKHDIYGLNLSSFTPAGGWITNELINRHLESALDKTVKICQDNIHSDPGNGERTIEMTLLRVGPSIARSLFLSDNAPFVYLGFGLLCAAFAVITCSRLIYSHINQVELAVREKNLWSMIGVLKYSWFRIVIVKTTLMIPSEPFHRLQKRLATEFEERKHERIRKEIEEREHEEAQDIINEVGKGALSRFLRLTTIFCSLKNVTKQASMELPMHLVHEREQQLEVELSTKRHDGDTQEKRRLTRVL
ncbi:proteasome activator subunit 4, partial [Tanacetum coccineum]